MTTSAAERMARIKAVQAQLRGERPDHEAAKQAAAAVVAAVENPHARKAEGYVPTPAYLATSVLNDYSDIADLPAGARVLEPSAGDGAFVRAILAANPGVQVTAVEPHGTRASLIPASPSVRVIRSTFEDFEPDGEYDAIVMNPPFSVPHDRSIWVGHVLRAWHMLAPGGRVTAIVPKGYEYREGGRFKAVRDLVEEYGDAQPLPDGAFGLYGTSVSTVAIWMARPPF